MLADKKKDLIMFPYPQTVNLSRGQRSSAVRTVRDTSLTRPDEYVITMTEQLTELRSASDSGFFYAEKTLRELPPDRIGTVHDWADVPLRIVMIDLKRISWNYSYLRSLFSLFADLKINACLLEYEDKFPYSFTDRIAVPDAFTREQLAELVRTARENHVELIPLVQCFSHWEYILKHDEFAGIREDQKNVSQGCPLNPGTFELFRSMLTEILEMHPDCRYVHIGGDEARLLGHCPACAEKVKQSGVERLYGDYIEQAMDLVNAHGRTPLFWADFFWHHESPLLKKNCIAVDWEYTPRAVRAPEVPVGMLRMNYGRPAPERYAPFLEPDAEDGTLFSFPHTLWLKKNGFQAFGAGIVNAADNVLAHAASAVKLNAPAVLATYWASCDSLSSPLALYPWRIAGIAMLGAAGWNCGYETANRSTFYRRLAEKMHDAPEDWTNYELADDQGTLISPMRYMEKPTPGKGTLGLFGKKVAFDYEMQTLFREKPLFEKSAFEQIPLGDQANSTLDFEVNGEPCKFTVGRMRFMPAGELICAGIPFLLEDRLALYGYYPGQTVPASVRFAVGKKHPDGLALIQSVVGYTGMPDQPAECIFHYRDTSVSVPLVWGKNLGNWWAIEDLQELRIAFANVDYGNHEFSRLGLHLWLCENPHPEKELLSVELNVHRDVIIALAGLTLFEKKSGDAECIAMLNRKQEELINLSEEFNREIGKYIGESSIGELNRQAFESHRSFLNRLRKLLS